MTFTELWLTYHQVSRSNKPCTAQLIELEFQNHKLADLEDVLEHVFRQGYVETKNRSLAWWERSDGLKIKNSHIVEDLLKQGVGLCQETALRLIIADAPSAFWFGYLYLHNPTAHVVTQRIKLDGLSTKMERLAHVTNHIFAEGFVQAKFRSVVYWQNSCGKRVEESVKLCDLLSWGEGVSEEKHLRLVIDNAPVCTCH